MTKLNKRTVEAARPEAREYVLWDENLPGFGLRIMPTGRRSYIVQYRVGGGRASRSRKATLGCHGVLTPEQARSIARDWLATAAQGGDPAAERAQVRNAPTTADLCERYLSEHAATKKKPRSAREDERNIANHIVPLLGTRKVADIATADIDRVLKIVKQGRTVAANGDGAPPKMLRGGPFAANRVRALLSKMLTLAERWRWRPDGSNPVRFSAKNPERPREVFLKSDELQRLGTALDHAQETGDASPEALGAIRFLTLTGCRVSEALSLRWDDVDFDRSIASLPDSKTGAKLIRLPEAATSILHDLAAHRSDNPYIFAGRNEHRPLTDLKGPWSRIRESAGLEHVRLHDLRHTVASIGVALRYSLPIIGRILGHTQAAMTQRYAHLADDPLAEAAETVAARIERELSQSTTRPAGTD
ncbi:MAG: tyrosine-type recombinase/integrase [Pseudomonadota bacterium]